MVRLGAVLFALVTLTGCPLPCDPTQTRCTGSVAQICGSDGQWRTLMDCAAEGMACRSVVADPDAGTPSGCTCLPSWATNGGD